MRVERKKQIEQAAQMIRDALHLENERIDIDEVVYKGLGGEIERVDSRVKHAKVKKVGERSFLIEINGTHSSTRQRISIAQEMGHLFLHMQYLTEGWDRIKDGVSYNNILGSRTELEQEANVFAVAFLMPEVGFKETAEKMLGQDGYYDLDAIAKYYDVSIDAVIYRGKNIGIWN